MNAFTHDLVEYAQQLRDKGIQCNPRVLVAQAVLESGWGKSELAKKYHNLFGLKAGTQWPGKTVTLPTREVVDGHDVSVDAVWRVYDTAADSLTDYVAFIDHSPYFSAALNYPDDDEKYLSVLVDGEVAYATDPNYKKLILQLIDELELKKFLPPRV